MGFRTTGQRKKNMAVRRPGKRNSRDRIRTAVFVLLPVAAFCCLVYLASVTLRSSFRASRVVFSGNNHLSDDELRSLGDIRPGGSLFSISGGKVASKLLASPWIRAVSVRKEYPDTLRILIREAEPFALLDLKGRLFIVDDKGKMLEQLKDSGIPFLPVISGDPFSEKEVFSEAIQLAGAIRSTGLLAGKDHIEIIAHRHQEMMVNLDGVLVKVGSGEYEEKLARLVQLEEEIRNRGIPVDYIDLRFENRVVVKQVNEVVR